MATLYISEYPDVNVRQGVLTPIVVEPALADQTKAFTGASAQSNAFNEHTRIVRLNTDAACSVLFGANPTALTTSKRLPANATEYFRVNPGDKVAVIANS